MEHVCELTGICKQYRSRKTVHEVLHDVSMTLDAGEVFGFIGPNGAGKTTLLRIMCGLARPTQGKVTILGTDLTARNAQLPTGIGVLVEYPSFIPELTGRRNLQLLASIRGVIGLPEVDATMELMGLDPANKTPAGRYSLGMRQRLGLAQAIMEKPRLLLLDEPTNGLDPQGVAELRSYIRHLADQGVAIFLASHLLNEVEQVCDRVAIVKQGHVLRQMSKNDPVPYRGFDLQVSGAKDWSLVQQWAAQHQATLSQKDGVQGGMVGTAVPVPAALRDLVQAGVSIESITPDRDTLETTFLQAIQEEKK